MQSVHSVTYLSGSDNQPLLPVTIRGEVPGRAMRGGADFPRLAAPHGLPPLSTGGIDRECKPTARAARCSTSRPRTTGRWPRSRRLPAMP
ncbi:hypothetical protein EOA33_25395 [Mesorhizobium sp. M4A.F.Ca.ET.050.02.1.1]|nr:hypothetical protein EOA33_25395 [Mesorhizobium sp. M4A.F.Ca.ET.050.02.1.1]